MTTPTPPTEEPRDWTVGSDGRSNSSDLFNALCLVVARLIRGDAHNLVAGRADATARLIVANLAHEHGLIPGAMLEEERHAHAKTIDNFEGYVETQPCRRALRAAEAEVARLRSDLNQATAVVEAAKRLCAVDIWARHESFKALRDALRSSPSEGNTTEHE